MKYVIDPKKRPAYLQLYGLIRDDIVNGNCKHLLNVYQMAVDYILKDKLIDLIGVSEWEKLRYGQKYDLAVKNNLFDGFDDVLRMVCFKTYGKEDQFQSENEIKGIKANYKLKDSLDELSTHWGLD